MVKVINMRKVKREEQETKESVFALGDAWDGEVVGEVIA
jgi:hypothetical protein